MKVHKNMIITGSLEDYPELRFTPIGRPLLTMRVQDFTISADESVHVIQAWDALAEEIAERYEEFRGGTRVRVTGCRSVQEWRDKDGFLHSRPVVNATEISLA